jgi:GNAT superfamily N-acetyltransferase
MAAADSYEIRLARPDEIERLPAIELAAAELFRGQDLGEFTLDDCSDVADLAEAQREDRLWVAACDGEPIGFAFACTVGGLPHLDEIDVLPAHGRRGVGAALLARVIEWARAQDAPSLTLSTFRDVAWNAPFYAKFGFRPLDDAELTAPYRALRETEAALGLPMHRRVLMRLPLRDAPR